VSVEVTCRTNQNATILRPKRGDTIDYEVEATGPQAIFALVDPAGNRLLSDTDPPVSPGLWRRTWPLSPDEVPTTGSTTHTLSMSFLSATKYTFKAERDPGQGTAKVVKDCDYQSTDPEETFHTALRLLGLQQ